MIDFVGNSGRHKLITAADVLGDELNEELIATVKRKALMAGQEVDILQALAQAKAREESRLREQRRREADERLKEEERLKKLAAHKRNGIMAGASYAATEIDPFDVFVLMPQREPAWFCGKKPTEKMKEMLRKAKIPFTEQTSYWECKQLIGEQVRRWNADLCTYGQSKLLTKFGYDASNMGFKDASQLIDRIKSNGWRRPE